VTHVARFETRASDGYERWRSWNSRDGDRYCYVHQLLAISRGADPRAVFSDGRTHVHHRSGVPWDNRPGNMELIDESVHAAHHNRQRGKA
jgi:hypothetical protein